MQTNAIVTRLKDLNAAYRMGNPLVSDHEYDLLLESLKAEEPTHPYLLTVEPEVLHGQKYHHESPMLSTDKAYLDEDISKWIKRIKSAAKDVGIAMPTIRATAKLNGVACRYKTLPLLATRGNGNVGNVITHLLDHGLIIKGDSSIDGVGEIVMPQAYFDINLSHMSHPLSVVIGIVNANSLSAESKATLSNGGVHLVLYKDMKNIELPLNEFSLTHQQVENTIRNECIYPIDGVVYEVVDPEIKEYLGASSHHNHWQVAKKQRGEGVISTVVDITYPIGRSGVLTPLIHINPIEIDGSMVTKMTGHYVGKLLENKIGIGAKVSVIKAGEIIPSHQSTLVGSDDAKLPLHCPHCGSSIDKRDIRVVSKENGKTKLGTKKEANWYCSNNECVGKARSSIMYHFELVQAQQFGRATVAKLVAGGFDNIQSIYSMTISDYMSCGLGEGQANNIMAELKRVQSEPMPDYRLIASLGISTLGERSGKRMFTEYSINDIHNVTVSQLKSIEGFGDKTSVSVTQALTQSNALPFLLDTYANVIVHTKEAIEVKEAISAATSVGGKKVVFTGTCSVPRPEMKRMAESIGCEVQKSVVKGTDYLICGDKVGQKKIEAAEKKGVKVITEAEFLTLID